MSWPMVRLGDVGELIRGSGIRRSETVPSGMPCLRYGEIYTSFEFILDRPRSFVEQKIFDSCPHIETGDVVFSLTGENKEEIAKALAYIGKDPIAAGGDLAIWKKHGCDAKYLAYLMYSPAMLKAKADASNGHIIVHASVKKLQDIQIPLPPLDEQKRIVKKLEKELKRVDEMKAKFERMEKAAELYFKSVLAEAFENVEGERVKLGDLYRFIDYRGMTPEKTETGVPLITAKNIRFGFLDYRDAAFISREDYLHRQTRGVAHKGDILFTTEAPLGYVAIADKDEFSTGQRIISFQWPDDNVDHDNKYFLYCFMSRQFQDQIKKNASGATAQGIKSSRLVNIEVVVPPFVVQRRVAAHIDGIRSNSEKMVEIAHHGVESCVKLRKALLAEAFA